MAPRTVRSRSGNSCRAISEAEYTDAPDSLTVTLKMGACSDGMSDRTYPFAVTLQVRGEKREGCAWTDKQAFSGPEHP